MERYGIGVQPLNPTNEQRYALLKNALRKSDRLGDFNNIIKLLSPPSDILNYAHPGEFKQIKVGIIGGGLAGMSAAFELRKLGFDITVFDALEDRVGGRVYTYYFDEDKKFYGELGPLRIPVAHETTWHYINLFGLATQPFIQNNPNAFVYVQETRARKDPKSIEEKIYPKYNLRQIEKNTIWPKLYEYAVHFFMNKLHPETRAEILKILPAYDPSYNTLLNISIRQNFEMLGLSHDAIDMIASVDAFTGALIDLSYNEVLQEDYPENFSYLYRVAGGNVNLPIAFYKSLTSKVPKEYRIPQNELGKVNWKGGSQVLGIYKAENEKKVVLRYKGNNIKGESAEEFDYVICAIPFTTLSTVDILPFFSNRKMQAIREINYVDGHRTLLLCKKRFWEEDTDYGGIVGGVTNTDLSITNILYPSDHAMIGANPNEPGVLTGSYNLNKYATHIGSIRGDAHFKQVKRQVEQVHGLPRNYLDSIVTQSKFLHWNNEEWFRGAVAFFTPEQKRIFSHNILKPEYDNRVFFAGEHTSATHGWMQGALFSGKLAANRLAYNAKIKKR
ncbi:NAD(P)-binding protein [Clostridium sp. P21]|uniref:NAD(P)-binding protein n=1 Tax=Clostridium muellerianum TaxID=2716538 RepID=A0A7Y0EFG8_9CLOT|nr:FAD-dependent oxidoreductase [Clostridium muellerianum]NMM62501.1 NAD(P)-binding protein [Clostridium muellerianum]